MLCLLIVSNLLVGAAGYVALRAADARYTDLIRGTVPTLNAVRAMAWQVSRTQRAINRFGAPDGISNEARLVAQQADLDSLRELALQTRAGLARLAPPVDATALTACQDVYVGAVRHWRNLVVGRRLDEAESLVITQVRPFHDACQEQLEGLASSLADRGLSGSSTLSGTTGFWGQALVAVATWPLWIAAVVFVVATLYILAMALLWTRVAGR